LLPLVNIHTHKNNPKSGAIEILNLHERYSDVLNGMYCSIGIHPWYHNSVDSQLRTVKELADYNNVLAIGECGLDASILEPLEYQEICFTEQIQIANSCNKPLIIHCVKAFNEVRLLLRKATVPAIFHGYSRKWTIAEPLIQDGHYLSFGHSILREKGAAVEVFRKLPANCFFLETDDWDGDIADIYKRAAEIRETTLNAIILQVHENFKKVFQAI
jgi:TatD DNase family protein